LRASFRPCCTRTFSGFTTPSELHSSMFYKVTDISPESSRARSSTCPFEHSELDAYFRSQRPFASAVC
jgi:hypothetical protein